MRIIWLVFLTFFLFPLYGEEKPIFTFVHLTDTQISFKPSPPLFLKFRIGPYKRHWLDSQHSETIFKETVLFINSLEVDLVVHTGDITQEGGKEEMEKAHQILSLLHSPWGVLMGDHDYDRNQGKFYYSVFKRRNTLFNREGYTLLLFSIYPSEEDFKWLRVQLKNSSPPVIFFTHRLLYCDPFTRWLAKRFKRVHLLSPDWRKIRKMLKDSQKVVMVVSGHIHGDFLWKREGIYYLTTSSLTEPPHTFRVFEVYSDSIKTYLYTSPDWRKVKERKWKREGEKILKIKVR